MTEKINKIFEKYKQELTTKIVEVDAQTKQLKATAEQLLLVVELLEKLQSKLPTSPEFEDISFVDNILYATTYIKEGYNQSLIGIQRMFEGYLILSDEIWGSQDFPQSTDEFSTPNILPKKRPNLWVDILSSGDKTFIVDNLKVFNLEGKQVILKDFPDFSSKLLNGTIFDYIGLNNSTNRQKDTIFFGIKDHGFNIKWFGQDAIIESNTNVFNKLIELLKQPNIWASVSNKKIINYLSTAGITILEDLDKLKMLLAVDEVELLDNGLFIYYQNEIKSKPFKIFGNPIV